MDKQGFIAIGLILLAWIGYTVLIQAPAQREWREKAIRYAEWEAEQAAKKNGGAQVGSASVGAPGTATPPGQRQPEQRELPKHPHKPGIAFATPAHELTLSSLGASVETATFKEILDTPYVAVAPDGYDDRRPREPLLVLRPFKDIE